MYKIVFALFLVIAWIDGLAQSKNPMDSVIAATIGGYYPEKYGDVQITNGQSPAIDELTALAISGDAKAQHVMGMVYHVIAFYCCETSERDKKRFEVAAAALFQASATQGVLAPMRMLGYAYQAGRGVEKDETKAIYWLERAAVGDDWPALKALGDMAYEGTHGFKRDKARAANYYQRAAKLGAYEAQIMLGKMHDEGDGVPQDFSEAMRWYVACQRDYRVGAEARTRIGRLYLEGRGVPVDIVKAYAWYFSAANMQISTDSGNRKAANRILKNLERRLSEEEISDALGIVDALINPTGTSQ